MDVAPADGKAVLEALARHDLVELEQRVAALDIAAERQATRWSRCRSCAAAPT